MLVISSKLEVSLLAICFRAFGLGLGLTLIYQNLRFVGSLKIPY